MIDIKSALESINSAIAPFLTENGFTVARPEGVGEKELPVKLSGNIYEISYSNEKNAVLIEWDKSTSKMKLYCGYFEDNGEPSYGEVSVWLFDEEGCDDKHVKSIANDFLDSLSERYGSKAKPGSAMKMMKPVSRNAVKNGQMSYDAKTLATRLAAIYPELKADVQENVTKYGDFMPDEFFASCAAPRVIDTIRSGENQVIKKLFNCFNEMYEDGSNEVQSLVAVTILGEMKNDEKLMAKAGEFMNPALSKPVIAINRMYTHPIGKKYLKKLENPPQYKPKKQKTSIMDRLSGPQQGSR